MPPPIPSEWVGVEILAMLDRFHNLQPQQRPNTKFNTDYNLKCTVPAPNPKGVVGEISQS